VTTFENTVLIARPIEDVFAFLSDLENVPKWNYAIVETRKVSEGPIGVGTTYQQVRSRNRQLLWIARSWMITRRPPELARQDAR
jgi:hypothetical protein